MEEPVQRIKTPIANFLMGIAGNPSLSEEISGHINELFRDVQGLEKKVHRMEMIFATMDDKKFSGEDPQEIVKYALKEFAEMGS